VLQDPVIPHAAGDRWRALDDPAQLGEADPTERRCADDAST
jgi:hypothetical protein